MATAFLILSFVLTAPAPPPTEVERARTLAQDGQWSEAAQALTSVDPGSANANVLALLTRSVLEAGDLRRARLLAERGVLRFPDDLRFRRLDLAVLMARRQWPEAAAAARSVLVRKPDDPVAWRQLAAATLAIDDPDEQRVILEAAHLAVPDDPVLFEKHVRAQFIAGHHDTAALLIEEADSVAGLREDRRFATLAIRVAEAAGRLPLARRWLARIPPSQRDTPLTLLEARIALADKDPRAAEKALQRLIGRGEASSAVLVRAGQLAEDRGAFGKAEALYRQAAEGTDDQARLARLFLARFLAKLGDRRRAEQVLRAYLAEFPADAYARQLLRIVVR